MESCLLIKQLFTMMMLPVPLNFPLRTRFVDSLKQLFAKKLQVVGDTVYIDELALPPLDHMAHLIHRLGQGKISAAPRTRNIDELQTCFLSTSAGEKATYS